MSPRSDSIEDNLKIALIDKTTTLNLLADNTESQRTELIITNLDTNETVTYEFTGRGNNYKKDIIYFNKSLTGNNIANATVTLNNLRFEFTGREPVTIQVKTGDTDDTDECYTGRHSVTQNGVIREVESFGVFEVLF